MTPVLHATFAAVAGSLLSACASPPPAQSDSERRGEQIAVAQHRADRALLRDDLRGAQNQYQLALDRGRAARDPDAIAVVLLNLAAVLHRDGDLAAARAQLMELLASQPPFGPPYAGRAEARLALIELQSNRLDEAARHAQNAEALCTASTCPWRIALANVQAGIALRSGDLAGAEARARAALAAATAAQDVREEANARRLLGEIAGERGRATGMREAK
jgi:tetratricopeptide (TPR) repeat protein